MEPIRRIYLYIARCHCSRCGTDWVESQHEKVEIAPGIWGTPSYPCIVCKANGHKITIFHVEVVNDVIMYDKYETGELREVK